MRASFKKKIIEVCNKKIAAKGSNVGLSFYAFFANKMMIQNYLWKSPSGGYGKIS